MWTPVVGFRILAAEFQISKPWIQGDHGTVAQLFLQLVTKNVWCNAVVSVIARQVTNESVRVTSSLCNLYSALTKRI